MAAAGQIAKPQLRRLLEVRIRNAVIGACATSILTGLLWKVFVMDARKKAYADFYKTYDDDKHFKIMHDAGLLQSCGPNK